MRRCRNQIGGVEQRASFVSDLDQLLGARVAVELSAEAARALVETIQAVLAKAAADGEIYTELGQLDFSSELAQIAAFQPDAVFTFMPGGMGVKAKPVRVG